MTSDYTSNCCFVSHVRSASGLISRCRSFPHTTGLCCPKFHNFKIHHPELLLPKKADAQESPKTPSQAKTAQKPSETPCSISTPAPKPSWIASLHSLPILRLTAALALWRSRNCAVSARPRSADLKPLRPPANFTS